MLKGKKRGTKTFFYTMLRDFILLLIVPLITILLIFSRADEMVREQIQESASKDLSLYCEQMEDIVSGMRATCLSVLADSDCKTYSLKGVSDASLRLKLRRNIYQFLNKLIDTRYHDIFIYYERDNMCLSGQYTPMSAELYYDTYYGEWGKGNRNQFIDMLKTTAKKPTSQMFEDYRGEKYLCMTMKASTGNTSNGYTVCVVLSPSYLDQSLVLQAINEEDVFQVYNEQMKLVLNNTPMFENQTMVESLINNEKAGVVNRWINRDKYMIQVRLSETLKNTYVYIVPSKTYWAAREQLRLYCSVGILICMLISIAFTFRRAKKTYNPIENIVEMIRNQGSPVVGEEEKQHELAYITSYIKSSETQLKEYRRGVKEGHLYQLLEGKYTEQDKALLQESGIQFPFERFAVCLFHIEEVSSKISDLYLFVIKNVLEELGNAKGRAYLAELSKKRCALIMNLDTDSNVIEEILQEGQTFLKKHFQIVMTVGVSNLHERVEGVSEAYREAQEAVRYRFIMGQGCQISYAEVAKRSLQRQNGNDSKIYMLLQDYIKEERTMEEVEKFVEKLIYIYEVNEEISIEAAHFYKREIVTALGDAMGKNKYEDEYRIRIVRELMATETMTVFQQKLSDCIGQMCAQNAGKKVKSDVCAKTKEFIDENYCDDQLSVAMIGKKMGAQSAYLSKLFKEAYGISMLDYIGSVRVQHAKRLLREKNLSVEETAAKVGFIDSNAFIRIFKKFENITPGKYKKLCEKGEIS